MIDISVPHALWWSKELADHAAEQLPLTGATDGRLYHPGVRSHLSAAQTHLRAANALAKPENDQVRQEAA